MMNVVFQKAQLHGLERVKKLGRKAKKHLRRIVHSFDKNIVFSIGENCLPDDILARNNIKSFSSPYSSGRSNIEYLLAFEQEEFRDFLNTAYLRYELYEDRTVVRNKKYVEVKNSYHSSVINGFEFSHHDIIGDERANRAIKRRCERVKHLNKKNIILVYYRRLCDYTDIELLASHIKQLEDIYKIRGNKVISIVFSQEIVSKSSRRIEKSIIGGVRFYKLFTEKEWSGNDGEVFWAKCDDDLLKVMIDDIKQLIKTFK